MSMRKRKLLKKSERSKSKSKNKVPNAKGPKINLDWGDEEIESESDDEIERDMPDSEIEDDIDDNANNYATESTDQKRKRLAKDYLAKMEYSSESDSNNEDDILRTEDSISQRLKANRLLEQGNYYWSCSEKIREIKLEELITSTYSGHSLSVTAVALSQNDKNFYSASKDNSLAKWDLETGQKQILHRKWKRNKQEPQLQVHHGEILAIAATHDDRYIVSGGRDRMIRVYDARLDCAEIKVFDGHRDAVTSLAFREDSYSLFSGSLDRCVKHWDLNEMGYLETLFGHQDGINAVDCFKKHRPITSSTDKSIRLWKVADETHLVFRGHKGTVDTVQLITEDTFISGGQEGSLCLWKESQKRPVATAAAAHGLDGCGAGAVPRWITSLKSLKMSDLSVSGSFDGYVRLWECSAERRVLREALSIPVPGFINSIALSKKANLMVVGTGREHSLGRWWNLPGDLNKIHVIKLPIDYSEVNPTYREELDGRNSDSGLDDNEEENSIDERDEDDE